VLVLRGLGDPDPAACTVERLVLPAPTTGDAGEAPPPRSHFEYAFSDFAEQPRPDEFGDAPVHAPAGGTFLEYDAGSHSLQMRFGAGSDADAVFALSLLTLKWRRFDSRAAMLRHRRAARLRGVVRAKVMLRRRRIEAAERAYAPGAGSGFRAASQSWSEGATAASAADGAAPPAPAPAPAPDAGRAIFGSALLGSE
jgi:hypothetical protein